MADEMKPTPRSPILGLFSDIVNLPLQYMSAPERTQQMQGTAQFLYGTGIPKTLERMSYGDSLFSGSGMTLRPKEETINAAMNVAPFAPVVGRLASRAVKATEGMPVGMGIKSVGDDIFNLSKQEFLGKPRITKNANAADLKPIELTTLKDVEPQPFMGGKYQIKMNEDGAVVLDKGKPIASYNFGDTLVVDKPYRKSGIAQELVYEWRTSFPAPAVAGERTKASQAIQEKVWERIQNEKRSLPEQSPYPQQAALDLAQQRAALPVEQGGLGLPVNNTPEMRAQAMGFDVNNPLYHATDVDFESIRPSLQGKLGAGVYVSPSSQYAEKYTSLNAAGNARVLPLVARGKLADDDVVMNIAESIRQEMATQNPNFSVAEWKKRTTQALADAGYDGRNMSGLESVITNPSNLRSRFAAFDPFRKDVATATAMGVALPDLLAQPVNQYQPTYETIPMYTDPFGNTIGSSIR